MDRFDAWLRKPRFSWLHFTAFVLAGVLLTIFQQVLPWWAADLAAVGSTIAAVAVFAFAMGILEAIRDRQRARLAKRG